jgi:hypothetical protein
MKTLESTSVSQKLNSELQLARIRLAKAQSEFESAKEQARLAKRRRKEAKQAARRARKQAKLAKSEVREAELVLAEAEAKLAQAARPPVEKARVKATPKRKSPRQLHLKTSATKPPPAAPVKPERALPSPGKHQLATAKKLETKKAPVESREFDVPTPALSIPGMSGNTVTGGTAEEPTAGKTIATVHIQRPIQGTEAGPPIQPNTN